MFVYLLFTEAEGITCAGHAKVLLQGDGLRIKELEELIENAVILDESNIDSSVISLGSTVKVLNKTVNAEFTYALVGSNEANPAEGKISDQSPIGAALINKKAGDEITVEVPNGTLVMKVLEVSRK